MTSFNNARKFGAEFDLFKLDFHRGVVLGKREEGVTVHDQEIENQNIKGKKAYKCGNLFKSTVEVIITVIRFSSSNNSLSSNVIL